ncbi:MAG: OB-fold protein [Saprospiraceae bacterium]|jgi:uncharacterized membrane protein
MKKIIYFVLGILIVVLIAYLVIMNMPQASVKNKSAVQSIQATELFAKYSKNENKANQTYNGKVVEVYGQLVNIDKDQQDATVMIIKASEYGAVMCTLDEEPNNLPQLGSSIKIKGQCNGFLGDMVILNKCILADKSN